MRTKHRIAFGDARSMSGIEDESVHLVVTSPPYWQLKDYGSSQQIGFQDTYEEYIENLNRVWRECYRVLHKGCRLCINIGDYCAGAKQHGRYRILPIHAEIIKSCVSIGFDFLGAIIWQKIGNCRPSGRARVMGSYPFPRNGIVKQDCEYILVLRKRGPQPFVERRARERSRLTREEWSRYFTGHWTIPGVKQTSHCAQFPTKLPRRLIRMFSCQGDTVLDPFLGSGTTTLAAIETDRHSIGYEINSGFKDIITSKIKKHIRRSDTIELSFAHGEGFIGQAVNSENKGGSEPSRTKDDSEKPSSKQTKRKVKRRRKASMGSR